MSARRSSPIAATACAVVAFAWVTAASALAHAEPTARPSPGATTVRDGLAPEARAMFDEGASLFRDGEFAAARARFMAAYEASEDARVLYNAAVCDKELGRRARAAELLRSSLAKGGSALPPDYVQRVNDTIATLSRYLGELAVESTTADAAIEIDGEPLRDPLVTVDAGPHVVTARKPGFGPSTQTVEARVGQRTRVVVSLSPLADPSSAAPPAALARLRVMTDSTKDSVFLDGTRVSSTPYDGWVVPGEHRVEVARASGGSKMLEIYLRPDESRDLRVTFDAPRSGLSPWWYVAAGVLVAGAATTAIAIAAQPTRFEGANAGTLNPFVVTASRPMELRR